MRKDGQIQSTTTAGWDSRRSLRLWLGVTWYGCIRLYRIPLPCSLVSVLCLTPLGVTALGSVSDPITVLSDPITVLSELRPHYKDSEHKLGLPKVRIQNTVRNSVARCSRRNVGVGERY